MENQQKFTEKIKHKHLGELNPIEEKNEFANFSNKCPKCGYDKAQIINCGIWYGDEDEVIRLKCGKCGYVEGQDGKIT